MTAVTTRPRAGKAKPAPVTSPLADILARISTSQDAIRTVLSATDEGSDLWTMLFGIDDNLMLYSLEPLYRKPVSKEDVGEAYDKLLFTLTVLKAALMMSKGLVMESTLQQAFEILDRAHSDMDCVLVQHWPIPDHPALAEPPSEQAPAANECWLDYLPLVQERARVLLLAVSERHFEDDNETLRRVPRIAAEKLTSIHASMTYEDVDEAIFDLCALISVCQEVAEAGEIDVELLVHALDLAHGLMYTHEKETKPSNFDEVKKALALAPMGSTITARAQIEGDQQQDEGSQDDPRQSVAFDATCEADAILRVLRKTLQDTETFLDVFNGMSLRLLELNSVAMSVVGHDTGRITEEMQAVVHGADA
ncbi:hypothetical protein BH10PSE18_BH10PSE18_07890 [soil metagenome]